jgi:Co/Zn/Cd efflux system component
MAQQHASCHPEHNNKHHSMNARTATSKEHVLNVAFFSFVAFAVLEIVFGTMARSEAMLADAHAMCIDAMTYLFNMTAEHYKKQPLYSQEAQVLALRLSPEEQTRRLELRRLCLELVPPAISVCILATLTADTLVEAFGTLWGNAAAAAADGGGDEVKEDDVSVPLMLGFSAANLLLDFVNVVCFSRANATYGLNVVVDLHAVTKQEGLHLLSSSTTGDKEEDQPSETTATGSTSTSSCSTIRYAEYGAAASSSDDLDDEEDASISSTDSSTSRPTSRRPPKSELINLNMCSAWTHVCADTLRSVAVVLAAGIATIFPSIPGETADAAAAVAVSIIIFVSLLPLIQGLVITAFEIKYLLRNPTTTTTLSHEESTTTAACSYHECSAC